MTRPALAPTPETVVCRAGDVLTFSFGNLAVTDDGMYWHDHSFTGGDIVCCGPFSLFNDNAFTAFSPASTEETSK